MRVYGEVMTCIIDPAPVVSCFVLWQVGVTLFLHTEVFVSLACDFVPGSCPW